MIITLKIVGREPDNRLSGNHCPLSISFDKIKEAIKMIGLGAFYTLQCSFSLKLKWLRALMTKVLATDKHW
jgi:hypothetical protein